MASSVRRVPVVTGVVGTAPEVRVNVGEQYDPGEKCSCAGGYSFEYFGAGQSHVASRNRILFWQARSTDRQHEMVLCEVSADHTLEKNSRIWVFPSPVMSVTADEDVMQGVFNVGVALANRYVVKLEFPHPAALHGVHTGGTLYSILSDEAREAVGMPMMGHEMFQDTEHAMDFYIPGPGGQMPEGPSVVAGTGRTFLHVWPEGEVSVFSQGVGFAWLIEPKNRLAQLSEFITGFTPTILRHQARGNRVIRAGGALLGVHGNRRNDLWATLTSGLELRAYRTESSGEDASGINVLCPECTIALREYVPRHLSLSVTTLLDDRHLLRVAPVPDQPGYCYVAAYVAVESQSFVILFEYRWGLEEDVPTIRHVGTVHAVPDTLTDLCIAERRLWYTAQTDTECAITFTDLKAKSFPGMATAVLSPHTIDDEPVVPADRDPGALYQAHLFESSRFSALAIESAFALYDKRAFQLYKLAKLVTEIEPSVFGCRTSQIVCAGGAALASNPAVGFSDLWIVLTSSLEIMQVQTAYHHDGGDGTPSLRASAAPPITFDQYTGGPGNIRLPMGVPDSNHLIRVASEADCPRDNLCYAAVYIASPSGGSQSLVVLLRRRPNPAHPGGFELKVIGTVHSVPDTVVDMAIVANQVVFVLGTEGGVTEGYRMGPLTSLDASFRGSGVRAWAAIAMQCDPGELRRHTRFEQYVLGETAIASTEIEEACHPYEEVLKSVGRSHSAAAAAAADAVDSALTMLRKHVAVAVHKQMDPGEPLTFAELEQRRAWKLRQWHDFRENCLLFEAQESAACGFCVQASTTGTTYIVTTAGLDALLEFAPPSAVASAAAAEADAAVPALERSSARADVDRIFAAVGVARRLLGPEVTKPMFESTRQHFETLVAAELQGDAGIEVDQLVMLLSPVLNFAEATEHIVETLWRPFVEAEADADEPGDEWGPLSATLFAGPVGVALVTEEVRTAIHQRLLTVRDLLFAFSAALRLRNTTRFDSDARAAIARLLPVLCLSFQRLYTMHWIASTPASPVSAAAVKSIERLLKVVNSRVVFEPRQISADARSTLLALFASEAEVLKDLHTATKADLKDDARRMARALFDLIRVDEVRTPNVQFCKFLLARCQLEELQEYLLLIGRNCGVTAFLRGQVHLRNGEMGKAKANFLRAVRAIGLPEEADLWSLLTTRLALDEADWRQRTAIYLTHVILFFKESIPQPVRSERDEAVRPTKFQKLHAARIVIDIARIALNTFNCSMRQVAEESEKTVSMLWANMFQASLDLGDHDEAFIAAVSTPNELHRRNNLQRLVSVLCERRAFADVVRFPYQRAQFDVLNILERKAEQLSVDAILAGAPNMYSVLYAYHVHTSDYGSAARAMFELAFKLEASLDRSLDRATSTFRDPTRAEALARLERLQQAYLAAMTALKLVVRRRGDGEPLDARDAFVIMPRRAATNKRDRVGSDDTLQPEAPAVDLLGPTELEEAYLIVQARTALVELRAETEPLHDLLRREFGPEDAVQMLTVERRFDLALSVAQKFKAVLSREAVRKVFLTVAEDCGRLSINPSDPEPNRWLESNDLDLGPAGHPPLTTLRPGPVEADPLDESNTFAAARSCDRGAAAWEYVRLLLRTFDAGPQNNYEHHVTVADVVMRLQLVDEASGKPTTYVPLPLWLQRSLERRMPAALIRLYLEHGDTERGAEVAARLLERATAQASETLEELKNKAARPALARGEARDADLKIPMMTVCLPYSELEGLLVELRKADRAHKQSFGLGGPGRGSGLQQVEAAWSGYAEVASEVAVLERHVPL